MGYTSSIESKRNFKNVKRKKMLIPLKDGKEPMVSTCFGAGADLFSSADIDIPAGATAIIPLGVVIDEKYAYYLTEDLKDGEGYHLELHPRSSLRLNLIVGVGIIDLDYLPNCKLGLKNCEDKACEDCESFEQAEIKMIAYSPYGYSIKKGDKVAQVVLVKNYTQKAFETKKNLRCGGFGSTGND
jgi:dUTPase